MFESGAASVVNPTRCAINPRNTLQKTHRRIRCHPPSSCRFADLSGLCNEGQRLHTDPVHICRTVKNFDNPPFHHNIVGTPTSESFNPTPTMITAVEMM